MSGNRLSRAGALANRVLRAGIVSAFLLMIGIAMLQIISRYLPQDFPLNLLWTGELATNVLVFVIFFGAVLAEIDGGQLRIDILRDQLEARIGEGYELFILVSSLLFTLVVVHGGLIQTEARWGSEGLLLDWFRVGYLYAFIAVSFALLSALRLYRAVQILRRLTGRANSSSDSTQDSNH